MTMKRVFWLLLIIAFMQCSRKNTQYADYPITAVSIRNVKINDNFWLPKLKLVQDVTIRYAFEKCEQEGRLQNFLVAGGKTKGAYMGKMPFDDTDVYKIIEGASLSLVSKPNLELDAYLDSIIAIIKVGQESDGYLTTWFTIDRQKPPAWWVKPSQKRWENEVSSHELYNSGHLFEAAAAHYHATGKRNFLEIALKNADLLVASFGAGKLQAPPGHQIVETGLIQLYRITRKPEYLELAKFFLDIRGDSIGHALYGDYSQDHLPVIEQTEAVGHAVRALYMYAGMTDIAVMYPDANYLKAVNTIWENVVSRKTYITGGLGARHEGESFGNDYELPNLTAYNETCAAIASVYWNQRLFLLTGDARYYDVLERTLYNGLISGISLDGKNFFYPNPTESDGKYQFNMGSATRQPWFDCSCCPTNLIRFLPSVPGLIYAVNKDSLFVNLYISNKAQAVVSQEEIEIIQQTEYPYYNHIRLIINPASRQKFTLKLRIPGWVQNQPLPGDLYSYLDQPHETATLTINGKSTKISPRKGYAEITRIWRKGDLVELVLPMGVRQVIANEKVADDSGKVAFESGPLVYCAEEIDNPAIDDFNISGKMEFNIVRGSVLTEKTAVIEVRANGKKFTLIPYYLWSNRGVGRMKVWFPRKSR